MSLIIHLYIEGFRQVAGGDEHPVEGLECAIDGLVSHLGHKITMPPGTAPIIKTVRGAGGDPSRR